MAARSDDEQPVFFVHVQKTGGLNLVLRLQAVLGVDAVYPPDVEGATWEGDLNSDVGALLDRWGSPPRPRVVAGHFPMATTQLLGVDFRVITVLRDPVERTLSYLRYRLALVDADPSAFWGDRGRHRSLEGVYDDVWHRKLAIENHMTRMFSLTPREVARGGMFTAVRRYRRTRLERAKANLEAVEVLGLQEEYADWWRRVGATFGWDLGEMPHGNRTEPAEVPDGLRDRIAEDNAYDMELYDHARRLVGTGG